MNNLLTTLGLSVVLYITGISLLFLVAPKAALGVALVYLSKTVRERYAYNYWMSVIKGLDDK